jgi:hypothetical protein
VEAVKNIKNVVRGNKMNEKELLNFIKLQEQILDLTIRTRVIETLLIKNNITSEEVYLQELNAATELIAKKIEEAYKDIEELKSKIKNIKPNAVEESK